VTAVIRPPEYFPRLAYAALLLHADCVVIADTLPYSRQSFQNRCRIRTAQEPGWMWLTIPLEAGAAAGRRAIHRAPLAPAPRWRDVHRKTIRHHLGSAPFFAHFEPEIDALLRQQGTTLADVTAPTVAWAAASLGAAARVVRASELPGAPASVPALLAAVGATELLTLPESAERDARLAAEAGAASRVLRVAERPRRQNFPGFVPECGILDLLLNHGPLAAALVLEACEP
jgi:hypothetical protein